MKATVRSKTPLNSRKKATSAASVANALCGCTRAQIPTPMKSTPRITRTIRQPDVKTGSAANSLMPAMIATMPNRYDTAYTVV